MKNWFLNQIKIIMKKYLLLTALIILLILSSLYGISQKVRADRLEESLSKEQKINDNFRKQAQLQIEEARKAVIKAVEKTNSIQLKKEK